MHKFWTYPSSYLALALWGASGFGYQPTFGAFLVHFFITAPLMLLVLWVAHYEGRKEGHRK